jgi:hypothetical protein
MAISVIEFLAKKGIPAGSQPHAPLIWVRATSFGKFHLKRRQFGTVDYIEKAVTDQLKAIPVSDYQRCYEWWEQRLWRSVASQGNYFEGDIHNL